MTTQGALYATPASGEQPVAAAEAGIRIRATVDLARAIDRIGDAIEDVRVELYDLPYAIADQPPAARRAEIAALRRAAKDVEMLGSELGGLGEDIEDTAERQEEELDDDDGDDDAVAVAGDD